MRLEIEDGTTVEVTRLIIRFPRQSTKDARPTPMGMLILVVMVAIVVLRSRSQWSHHERQKSRHQRDQFP